ncbi:MAG TPA: DUF268 domain-containing protein [Methylobacter sp.]
MLSLFGFNLNRFLNAWPGLIRYLINRRLFYAQSTKNGANEFSVGKPYPCLTDRFDRSGVAQGHYFHQDLLVAQLIYRDNPLRHLDVGSRIDGFVAHVAVFREIEVFDIRPLTSYTKHITFKQMDISNVDDIFAECTDSLSCLHALEHFGLGRYGDKVDFDGHIHGFRSLVKMLTKGGKLYFSVPIGKIQRVEFDAHRVFSLPYLNNMFRENNLEIVSFHYVDDSGMLHENANAIDSDTFCLEYGCGIFELTKEQTNTAR